MKAQIKNNTFVRRCRNLFKEVLKEKEIETLKITFEVDNNKKVKVKMLSYGLRDIDEFEKPLFSMDFDFDIEKKTRRSNPNSLKNLKKGNAINNGKNNIINTNKKRVEEENKLLKEEKSKIELEKSKIEEEKKVIEIEKNRLEAEKNAITNLDNDVICNRCLGDIEVEQKALPKVNKYKISKLFKEDKLNKGYRKVLRSYYNITKKFEDLVAESLVTETNNKYKHNKEFNNKFLNLMSSKVRFTNKKIKYRNKIVIGYASIYEKYLTDKGKKDGETFLYLTLQELGFRASDEENALTLEQMRRCYEYVKIFKDINLEVPKSDVSPKILFEMGTLFGEFLTKVSDLYINNI